MLLFPGEASLYKDLPGFTLLPAGDRELLVCTGSCNRSDRPLSCRLFPLLPVLREDGIHAAKDARAKAICPLHWEKIHSFDSAFVEAIRAVGNILLSEPETEAFLLKLTKENDELKALQRQFR